MCIFYCYNCNIFNNVIHSIKKEYYHTLNCSLKNIIYVDCTNNYVICGECNSRLVSTDTLSPIKSTDTRFERREANSRRITYRQDNVNMKYSIS